MGDAKPNRLAEAYRTMLERVQGAVADIEKETLPAISHAIDKARESAVELEELTREEAERVAGYLRRDLRDAGEFVERSGKDLGGWLRFDAGLIERTLADLFAGATDRTKAELQEFSLRAEALGEWHSGEVAGPGTLQCKSCGEEIHFYAVSHIPPCPRCRGTTFRRQSRL